MKTPRYYRTKRALAALAGVLGHLPGARAWSDRTRRRLRLYSFADVTGYASQWGQDMFVDQCVFGERRGGTFVDIGANDGLACSNTYFFETTRGWSGLCVEPQPSMFAELQRRRRCVCVEGCAGTSDGDVPFTLVEGDSNLLSGRPDIFPEGHERRIADTTHTSISVKCYEINALIRRHGITSIDFLSIDTEGGEDALVAAMDLDAFNVRAIAIENNYNDRRIEAALDARGYDFVAWMGSDEIYVRRA